MDKMEVIDKTARMGLFREMLIVIQKPEKIQEQQRVEKNNMIILN